MTGSLTGGPQSRVSYVERTLRHPGHALAVAGISGWTALLMAPSFFQDGGSDVGVYFNAGRVLAKGHVLYRDFWDHKPPGIDAYFAGWQLVFGSGWYSAKAAIVVVYAIFGISIYVFAWSVLGRRALAVAAAVVGVYFALRPAFDTLGDDAIVALSTALELLSLSILFRTVASGPRDSPRLRAAAMAGLLAGAAFEVRQTALTPLIVLAPLLAWQLATRGRSGSLRGPLLAGAAFAGTAAAVVAVAFAALAAAGAGISLVVRETVTFNRYYTSHFLPYVQHGWSRHPGAMLRALIRDGSFGSPEAPLWIGAVAALGASLGLGWVGRSAKPARGVIVLFSAIAGATVILLARGQIHGHHRAAYLLAYLLAFGIPFLVVPRGRNIGLPAAAKSWAFLGLCAAAAVALVVATTGVERGYSLQFVPYLAVLAVGGTYLAARYLRAAARPALAAVLVAALFVPLRDALGADLGVFRSEVHTIRAADYSVADLPDQQTAAVVKRLLRPGDTLFVYGFRDWLYTMTGALSPIRYYSGHLMDSFTSPTEFGDAMRTLRRHPPRVVVETTNNVPRIAPAEPGNLVEPDYVRTFESFLRPRYALCRTIVGGASSAAHGYPWLVYLRRPVGSACAPTSG